MRQYVYFAVLIILIIIIINSLNSDEYSNIGHFVSSIGDTTINVGDEEFPLWINKSHLKKKHKLVGKKVKVNNLGNPDNQRKWGKIKQVIIKFGQIAGFEVKLDNGGIIIAPLKNFYIEGKPRLLEDINLFSPMTQKIRNYLNSRNMQDQHSYYGPYWEAIERLHLLVAHATETAAIETMGSYTYPSSTHNNYDGRDWQMILPHDDYPFKLDDPDERPFTMVNGHSVQHNPIWTLQSTVTDEFRLDASKLNFITHQDPWIRSMLWTIELASLLHSNKSDNSKLIEDLHLRLDIADKLRKRVQEYTSKIAKAYKAFYKNIPPVPSISIVLNGWALSPEKTIDYIPNQYIDELELSVPYGMLLFHMDTNSNTIPQISDVDLKHFIIHAFRNEKCTLQNDAHYDFRRLIKVVE